MFNLVLAFYTLMQLIGYSLYIEKILGQGCLFDLKFFETPVANLRPIVKLSKLGFTQTHNVREGVRLMCDAV